ncbi:MAG: hypothetical protein R2699_18980 [Acidimicrobiales bacterium]
MSTDIGIDLSKYKLGWHDDVEYVFKPKRRGSTRTSCARCRT